MSDLLLDSWAEAVDEFPLLATDAEKLRALVRYAVLAPSGHNSQPWKFRLHEDALELRADRSRAMPVRDPADRQLIISLGAALFHLRIAARRFGRHVAVDALPDEGDRDLVARVRLGGEQQPAPEELRLFAAIPCRRTSRFPFEDRVVTHPVAEEVRRAAAMEGGWACRVPSDRQPAVAQLVAEGDRRMLRDARYRREVAGWLHANQSDRRDGVPAYTEGVGDLASLFAPLVVRSFDLGRARARHDQALALAAPLLLVLGTNADEPSDWLVAGQALARLLLTARDAGLHASFLNQPVEVDELRGRLRALLGRPGVPQLVLRLGYGREVRPTPRRPLAEVLED